MESAGIRIQRKRSGPGQGNHLLWSGSGGAYKAQACCPLGRARPWFGNRGVYILMNSLIVHDIAQACTVLESFLSSSSCSPAKNRRNSPIKQYSHKIVNGLSHLLRSPMISSHLTRTAFSALSHGLATAHAE